MLFEQGKFISGTGGRFCPPVQHRLDEIRIFRNQIVVLTDKSADHRRKKIQSDNQALLLEISTEAGNSLGNDLLLRQKKLLRQPLLWFGTAHRPGAHIKRRIA